YKNNLFYENRNGKFFKEKAEQAGIDIGITRSVMGIWSDVNNDGKLDLFVTNEDTTNMLFLNRGGGKFVDVTEKSGIETEQRGNGACFGDLDLDGDPDLVVTFQNLRDRIYRNDTPAGSISNIRFTDVTEKWWPAQKDTNIKSVSCVLADYDNDGDLDLFIAHKVFSNRLYENDGSGHLRDVTFEAGLVDSSITNSAGFFDADNDGDLDLYVANRGKDVFYENLGNKRFKVNEDYFGKSDPLNTTDFACGDPDNDGDIDCVLPRGVVSKSVFFRNELNNGNFIKIKLIGVKSNRSAIGGKAFLYEAGHLDEIAFCKGLREISSSSGFGSMNSHSIHFGVEAGKNYDLRVIFPSGINIVRKNISTGSILQIYEQEGFVAVLERAKQFILFSIKNRERQLEFGRLLLLLLLIFVLKQILIWKRKLSAKNSKYLFVSGLVPYVLLDICNANLANPYPHLFLFLISILVMAITVLILARKKTLLSRDLIIEELNLTCRNFDHGNWAASHLNQIQLFSSNLRKNEKISQEIRDEIQESIADFYGNVYKEISKIGQLAKRAKVETDKAYQLENLLISLSEVFNKIKVELMLKQKIERDFWEKSFLLIDNIKKSIQAISAETRKIFQCDLIHVLQKTIARFERQNDCIVRHNFATNEKKIALMREPDLMAIFENLLTNACNAMRGQKEKAITIECCRENKSAIVRVKDTGVGIPRKYWESIFRQNYSTKPHENGGFGLYFARTKLEKFGGSIKVERSAPEKGTTILVTVPTT
ncbi:MAG: GHKL domain-containing protein, partial [Calditrichaeota bacterium]|nr:GHKL domain-containing protein [Calditrichota bacterium]